ncbi:isoleucine--tRNA ligase [Patescibacteria group bacterium]|nr:isoleucine--tRNA ligase [Patescibacteria group bacterium]MCG2687403.1 isoleucine--tRNA ligase [Candidatus Parcubacteria bacterium]
MEEQKKLTHAQQEEQIADYWDKHSCFEKSVQSRPEGQPYKFYDGPPFATGLPHYGHILASIMKDVIPRYWTMRGYRVERVWGWDCHGLPVENIVEKQFDLGSRKDIEKFGVAEFNDKCQDCVLTYVDEWKKVIRRLGRWVDMENAYKTMDVDYMESIWWVFKSLWDKEMIYEGRKPMHICPRCETVLSNFEVTQGYQDVTDISVTVKLKVKSGKYKDAFLLAWTTTPWTLPGNALVAVNPDMDYLVVQIDGSLYIIGKLRHEAVLGGVDFSVIETLKGHELVGLAYEPLFPFFKDHKNAFRIVAGDFVTAEDGTGLVHIAPGFGEDDMQLGLKEKVDPIMHVRLNGTFVDEVGVPMQAEGYEVKDRPMKKKGDTMSVDIEVLKWLAHHDKLFSKEKVVHSYPHCWRCDTPLLNYSTTSWFVRVTQIKDQLVRTNKEINWVPDNIKEGRFGKWLEGARDWAISRSRFWGTPLPIWKSEDNDFICVGSRTELEELSGIKVDNLHKHIIDKIVIKKNGKTYHRINEVLDCWFESGSMPYASIHYPFENKLKFDQGFPADFVAEGQDQTRGWFYVIHVLSNALFGMPAFKNVIVNGIVLAEDGKKMSKRLKNYPDPMEVMQKYGADAVRYYLMSTPAVRAESLRFSEAGVDEVAKKFITILRNVLSFYELYKEHDDGREPGLEHVLDGWIISRLNQTLEQETSGLNAYELSSSARVLQGFVTDLSTWYVRRSRDRMKIAGEDRQEALATLRVVLETFAKMTAPYMPYLGEVVYQGVKGGFDGSNGRLSVHLENWPAPGAVDQQIIDSMGQARAIVSRVLDAREEAGRPIKQALADMVAWVPSGEISLELQAVILDEVNIKTMKVQAGDLKVEVNIDLTPELIRDGMARDIVRRVNQMRKEAGFTIQDRISLKIYSEQEEVKQMFAEHQTSIKDGTLADSVEFVRDGSVKYSQESRIAEQDIWMGF